MNFRRANLDDVALLTKIRKTQLVDEGLEPNTDITDQLQQFFAQQLTSDSFTQIIVTNDENEVMATGAIIYYNFPPSYHNPTGKRGYVANMYTAKSFRGQGLATQILDQLMDDARARTIQKIFLYGSEMGKPVYKKYGFEFVDAYMEYTIPSL